MEFVELLQRRKEKTDLFEYFVCLLYQWNCEMDDICKPVYTKLQLQKLLFLTCAIDATAEHHEMLDIFDRFYALPYGPVEMDIYEAMNCGKIGCINIVDRDCIIDTRECNLFNSINYDKKCIVERSVLKLKSLNINYFSMSSFDLVEISHGWTAWRDAYSFAILCGSKQEPMSIDAICNSDVKCFDI